MIITISLSEKYHFPLVDFIFITRSCLINNGAEKKMAGVFIRQLLVLRMFRWYFKMRDTVQSDVMEWHKSIAASCENSSFMLKCQPSTSNSFENNTNRVDE